MFDELIVEGCWVLLFLQFILMFVLIEDVLCQCGVDYVLLIGEICDCCVLVQCFQSSKVLVFLISLKVGGVGFNLIVVDIVIYYDFWWNLVVENQVSDCVYCIGQDKLVFVYWLIVCGMVEEKIQYLQQEKVVFVDGLFSEGNGDGWKFDEVDIDVLFVFLFKVF